MITVILVVMCVVVGVRRNRPARPVPWYLLGATILFGSLGDALYALDGGREGVLLVLSDVSYLLMVPLVTAGLIGLTRASVVLRDRLGLVGTLMATCAAGLIVWVLVVSPVLRDSALDAADRYMIAGFMLGDLLILAVAGRLLLAMPRNWSVILVMVGAVASLAGDMAYALATMAGQGWQDGPAKRAVVDFVDRVSDRGSSDYMVAPQYRFHGIQLMRACAEQCSATDPSRVLRIPPRPRLPTTSRSAPSARWTRCAAGAPATTVVAPPAVGRAGHRRRPRPGRRSGCPPGGTARTRTPPGTAASATCRP